MKVSLMNPVVRELVRDPHCTSCKLSAQATGNDVCITAEGPAEADLMIVTKLPLGPKSRKELHDYLAEVGIDPEEVSITSVNKCKVWDITAGKADQKACTALYLNKEIEAVKPKWVLALGNEALTATTGKAQITKYRGQIFTHKQFPKTQVVGTISPSMVNRNPGQRDGFIADLRYIKRLSEGRDVSDALKPKSFRIVTSKRGLQALADELSVCEGYAFDIETNGFDEFKPDSKMVSLALTTWMPGDTAPRNIWAIPLYHNQSPFKDKWQNILKWLAKYMRMPKKRIAHNGKFDLRWLTQFGCGFDLTFDTMLAAHLLNENRPKGLKPLARSLLGVEPWDIDTKSLLDEPLRPTLKYNGLDTWYTAHVYFILAKQLKEQPRLGRLMLREMVPASNDFVEIEMRGIWTDREQLNERAIIAKRTLDEIDRKLLNYVPPKDQWPPNTKEVNFNASNFARWWLFDHLGLPIRARGKSKEDGTPGAPSMAEGILSDLQETNPHPVLDLLLERVKWQKFHSSFFSAYQEQIDGNDRIHTTFKLTGTVTGRLSSGKGDQEKVTGRVQNRGVNLQQVPRDSFVKGIFGGPPGHVFLECDYSQVELRVAAFLADEKTMKYLYSTNQDIHMATAMKMTGKTADLVTKDERKKAKPVNFGFLYGMSAATFVTTAWNNYGVRVTEEESVVFRRAFFDQFPDLLTWHKRQRALARKYGRVESPLGRVRHLPDITSKDHKVRAEAERQAINSPVQSFASDLAILALTILMRKFRKMGLMTRSVGTVHDAINFEVPIEELPIVMPMIKHWMENVPIERWFGVVVDIPIVGDVAVSKMWGDKEEVDGDIVMNPDKLEPWLKERELWVPGSMYAA